MPKPIAQRGFEVSKSNSYGLIRYCIDNEGNENIDIFGDGGRISIGADKGVIFGIWVKNPQVDFFSMKNSEGIEGIACDADEKTLRLPKETLENNFEQAKEIYDCVVKLLEVKNKIKEYTPRFSHESELTLYNLMGIEDLNEFETMIRRKN
jgi:hypothetical protein